MNIIAQLIHDILQETKPSIKEDGTPHKSNYELNQERITFYREEVKKLLQEFPLYPELDLEDE